MPVSKPGAATDRSAALLWEPSPLQKLVQSAPLAPVVARARLVWQRLRPDQDLITAQAALSQHAILLRSGVSSARAAELTSLAGGASAVDPPTQVAAVIAAVARISGAPQAWGYESLAAALGSLLEARQRRRVLLAGPKSSIVLIALLPLLSVALGYLIGFDPGKVLLSENGMILLFAGTLLLLLGVLWLQRQVAATAQADRLAGFECELTVLALRGGLPVQAATKLIADEISASGCAWLSCDALGENGAVQNALRAALGSGAPLAQLLLQAAATERSRAAEAIEKTAEKLGNRVLAPLALCVLPAFVLLGVIPVVISMFGVWVA